MSVLAAPCIYTLRSRNILPRCISTSRIFRALHSLSRLNPRILRLQMLSDGFEKYLRNRRRNGICNLAHNLCTTKFVRVWKSLQSCKFSEGEWPASVRVATLPPSIYSNSCCDLQVVPLDVLPVFLCWSLLMIWRILRYAGQNRARCGKGRQPVILGGVGMSEFGKVWQRFAWAKAIVSEIFLVTDCLTYLDAMMIARFLF